MSNLEFMISEHIPVFPNDDDTNQINEERWIIASELGIADKMDAMAMRKAFVAPKTDKNNFENSLSCRHDSLRRFKAIDGA